MAAPTFGATPIEKEAAPTFGAVPVQAAEPAPTFGAQRVDAQAEPEAAPVPRPATEEFVPISERQFNDSQLIADDALTPEQAATRKRHNQIVGDVTKAQAERDSQFTFVQRQENRLGVGTTRAAANDQLLAIGALKDEIAAMQSGEAAQAIGLGLGVAGQDPAEQLAGRLELAKAQLRKLENEYISTADAVQNPQVEDAEGNTVALPNSPAMVAFQQAGDDAELRHRLMQEFFPEIAAEAVFPSIAQGGPAQVLVPGGAALVTRIMGGSRAATTAAYAGSSGLVSGLVEYDASFSEFLQTEGVDLTDMGAVSKALEDPKLVAKGRKFAKEAGLSVGMWDMLGAYGATKMLVPPGIKNKIARNFVNGAAQFTSQVGTGAAGEATKQVVHSGKITNVGDIELEAIGEFPFAISEPIVFKVAQQIGLAPKDLMTPEQVLDAYLKNPQMEMNDALEMLKEVAANGMTDAEAVAMIQQLSNLDPKEVLHNTHEETAQFGRDFQDVARGSAFEDSEGNTLFGDEIFDKAEPTGQVYWSNGEYTNEVGDTTLESSTQRKLDQLDQNVATAQREFEIAQAQGSDMTAINMTSNVLEAAKEKQTKVRREVAALNAVRPELAKLLTEMQKTFLPNTDIMVVEDNHMSTGLRGSAIGSAGAAISPVTGKRTQVIYLNTASLLDTATNSRFSKAHRGNTPLTLAAVMGHEFGHGMMQTLTNTLPKEVIQALKAEHRKFLADVLSNKDRPMTEVLGMRATQSYLQHAKVRAPKRLGNPYKVWEQDSKRELTYNLSFNEWIADAVSKQLSEKSTKGLPPLVKKVAPRIGALMDAFTAKFPAAFPNETTSQFLKFIANREQVESIQKIRQNLSETQRGLPDASTTQVITEMLSDLDIPADVQEQINNDMAKYNRIMRWGATLLQLGKANPHIPGLQRYIKAVHEHWVTKSNWNDQAMQTMNAWRKLGKHTGDTVGRFLLERTVQSQELGRRMTQEEQEQMMRQQGMSFGAKQAEALEVIRKIDSDFNRSLDSLYMIEKNRINQDWRDFESQRKSKIVELDQTFDSLRDRNYFPLSRFGVWGISMKAKEAVTINGRSYAKNETLAMELFENKKQRNKALGRLKRQFGPAIQETFFKVDETMAPFTGLPLSIMRNLKDNPKLGLTEDQKKKMLEMIDTLSPTQSIAKRMLERKGTAGFSRDAQRGYANYMMQIGGHLAKMQHVGQMDDAIKGVRDSANYLGTRGIVNDKRYEIAEHLGRHQDYIMNPVNEWGGMRALAFVWFLGYNPKSALVNLTQIPLVAYPYLAARKELTGGLPGKSDAIAIAELTKAMKDVRKIFQLGGTNITEQENNVIARLTPEIDESLATELAGLAHGDLAQRLMPRETAFTETVHRGSQAFLRGSTGMFQAAEKFNRRAVALATIRLAQKQGMTPEQQLDEAREALRTTQFEYARWNRAAFMRGKAGTFFVFMQYLQNVLSFTVQDPGRVRYLLMLLMAAGLQGLPGAEDLLDLYDFASRNLKRMGKFEGDPRSDVREQLRETILTLDASPELVMHGLSAQSFGFGMTSVNDMLGTSLPSLTFEGSISAGRIIPGWESLMGGRDVNIETAKDIAGAAITIPMNILAWTRDEDPDSIRALERTAPSVVKGALKAYRGWTEGELKDPSGNTLVDFDMNNPEHVGELIGMGMGASPTRLAREHERRWAVKEATMYYATMRQNLQKDYNYAMEERRKTGDTESKDAAVETIRWFNRNVPKGQQLIDYGGNYARWKTNAAKDASGVGRRTLDLPLQREIEQSFPAATEERIR